MYVPESLFDNQTVMYGCDDGNCVRTRLNYHVLLDIFNFNRLLTDLTKHVQFIYEKNTVTSFNTKELSQELDVASKYFRISRKCFRFILTKNFGSKVSVFLL